MLLIAIFLLITTNLYLISKVGTDLSSYSNWQLISQYISLVGTVLLSLSFVLGSRAKFLEKIFGGLDKVIKMHHIIGGISFVLLLHHPLFLILSVLPDYNLALQYLFFSQTISYNFGIFSLYLMVLLLILTMVIKLPYHIWIKTHDFFGLVLFFACLHVFFITSDVSRYLPLRIWMFVNLAMGMFFYIYKIFLYKKFGPQYKYRVERVDKHNNILEIYLSQITEKIDYLPGQFAFVSFDLEGLAESHPFSFSSSPDDEVIRFTVKSLGDYSSQLQLLTVGVNCTIWGPYGSFNNKFWESKDIIFIAGGIGITPFVSMIRYEVKHKQNRNIKLFYFAKDVANPIYGDYFTEAKNILPNFEYFYNCGDMFKNISNLGNKTFYICGPREMMKNYSQQLINMGVKRTNIIFEDFNFK